MRFVLVAAAVALASFAAPARAEVASATAGGFVIEAEVDVAASPDQAWRALGQLPPGGIRHTPILATPGGCSSMFGPAGAGANAGTANPWSTAGWCW